MRRVMPFLVPKPCLEPPLSLGSVKKLFLLKRLSFSGKMCQNHCKKHCLRASPNSAADPADPPDPAETQHPVQNRPWVPRAGGQDYGSLHTNSLKPVIGRHGRWIGSLEFKKPSKIDGWFKIDCLVLANRLFWPVVLKELV